MGIDLRTFRRSAALLPSLGGWGRVAAQQLDPSHNSSYPRHASCLRGLSALLLLLTLLSPASAEERVVVRPATPGPMAAERTLTGTIVDYNGKELRMELTGGQTTVVPAARVAEIQFQRSEAHAQAREHFAAGRYAESVDAYRTAVQQEMRPWVRRILLAEVVTCFESQGEIIRAAETYLSLLKLDEHWQYFERIPLAWTTSFVDGAVEARAATWLERRDSPPAQLLGASWSLSGPRRGVAVELLRELSNHTDPRIAHLADAQLWRANLATVGPQELNAWQGQIDRMPAELRPGPYLVLGKGWLAQDARKLGPTSDAHKQAANAFLRAPVLVPERHALAAAGLEGAADALARLQWHDEETSVLRELASRFPQSAAGEAAKRRLAEGATP